MKKLELVVVRRGKRVVRWLNVFLMLVVLAVVMTLVRRGVEEIWNAADSTHQIEGWRYTLSSVATAAATLAAVFVLFAWNRPTACSIECDDSAGPLAQ